MSPLESIIYMIWRGVAVGVLISAPMGPVGILCIQRTLDKGRHAGFYTGVGAAISDLFYCLLTGFGLSFIEDFIERNQNVIQLVGSIVLIAFSVYLFRKDPSSPLRRPVPQNVSVRKNILGGFLFTFSNPLIIFLIIGLFARFNFTSPEIKGAYYAIGYIFIVAGALGWWYGITYAIEKVRSKFNMRAMKIMNIVIGVIILIFACVGIVNSISGLTATANAATVETRYIHPESGAPTDTLTTAAPLHIAMDSAPGLRVDFKARPLYLRTSARNRDIHLFKLEIISGTDNPGDTMCIQFYVTEHAPDPISSQSGLGCVASCPGGFSISAPRPLIQDIDLPAGWCHYRISLTSDDALTIAAGSRRLSNLLSVPADALPAISSIREINLAPAEHDGRLEIRDLRLTLPAKAADPCMDLASALRTVEDSSDPVEGMYEVFDWSMDTKYARQGGDYRLLAVSAPDGHYDLLYIDGASTLSSRWQPGMVKARLIPTGSRHVFRLQWYDAEGDLMQSRLRAQAIPAQKLLVLSFPAIDAELRLRKIR